MVTTSDSDKNNQLGFNPPEGVFVLFLFKTDNVGSYVDISWI